MENDIFTIFKKLVDRGSLDKAFMLFFTALNNTYTREMEEVLLEKLGLERFYQALRDVGDFFITFEP